MQKFFPPDKKTIISKNTLKTSQYGCLKEGPQKKLKYPENSFQVNVTHDTLKQWTFTFPCYLVYVTDGCPASKSDWPRLW